MLNEVKLLPAAKRRTARSILKLALTAVSVFLLTITAEAQSHYDLNRGELIFCDNTDNDVNPINQFTSASESTPVNFLIKFPGPYDGAGNSTVVFAFEIYRIESGEEKHINDFTMRMDAGYRRYATEQGTYFREPGRYVVYCIDYRSIQQGYKLGNYAQYYGKSYIDIN